jgi:hypothetical protein
MAEAESHPELAPDQDAVETAVAFPYHCDGMSTTQPITILFADVSGSTKLFELKGDVVARQLVSAVLGALGEVAGRHGGRVIKTIGDEVMCTFPTALQGLLAAIDMQRRIAHDVQLAARQPRDPRGTAPRRRADRGGRRLRRRGEHRGTHGLARQARADRDHASSAQTTGSGGAVRTRALGTARVSGKLLPIEIVDVLWQDDMSNVTTVQRAIKIDDNFKIAEAKLTARYRGRVMELSPTSPPFILGRDPERRPPGRRRVGLAQPRDDRVQARLLHADRPLHQRHLGEAGRGRRTAPAPRRGPPAQRPAASASARRSR